MLPILQLVLFAKIPKISILRAHLVLQLININKEITLQTLPFVYK
jgi:hypothetical protein